MIKILFLVLLTETWNTVGQTFFKKATHQLATPHLKSFQSYRIFIGKVLRLLSRDILCLIFGDFSVRVPSSCYGKSNSCGAQ